MIKYIVPFLSILLVGCVKTKKDNFTYFGGKIINPKSDYVMLYNHSEELVDSIKLRKNNTFRATLKDIKAGLYFFKHGGEYQYIFLQPKDSLLLRLNTWDFDESLVFSGPNAQRNNYLIDTFLENEQQESDFYRYYSLAPKDFLRTVDSLKQIKDESIETYKANNATVSKDYLAILKIAMYYPLYTKLENYIIKNCVKEEPLKIAIDSFTTHREHVNINNDSLMFFSPYRKYLYNHLYYDVYLRNIKDDSDDFTTAVLETVNNKITSQKLKNKLLKETIIRHFYTKSSCGINKKAYNTFASFTTNEPDKEEIRLLLSDAKQIPSHKRIPNFKVFTPQGSLENITEITKNKPSVIYFRNKEYSSDKWVASRINYLMHKNPGIQFLIIDIHENKKQYIKGLDIKNQFYLPKNGKAHDFLTSKYPRMVLVNKKGIVKNGFCGLSSKKIEHQITKL